jgi:hypothetical protein
MLQQMSGKTFSEWWAYSEIEPFGRDWLQTGVIASTIFNRLPHNEPLSPEDFIPGLRREEEPEPPPDELAARVDAIFSQMKAEQVTK